MMDWKELGKKVAGLGIPLLGGALGGPGGAALGGVVASALGLKDDSPDTISQALTVDPEAAIKLKELENSHKEKIEELAFQRYAAEMESDTKQQAEINETMRTELATSGYKSGWRPLFGYISALGFGGILAALVISMFREPSSAGDMIESATVVLSLMLTVLGVNITSRSKDKQAPIPTRPVGLIEALATRIAK